MKRNYRFAMSFGLAVFSGGLLSEVAIAQHSILSRRAPSVPCNCRQWTCPACQQAANCLPATPGSIPAMPGPTRPSGPDTSIAPTAPFGVPSPDSSQPSLNGPIPQSGAAGLGNTGSGGSSPAIDYSQITSNNRSDSGQQGTFGSSSYLDNAIEFQGDQYGGQTLSEGESVPVIPSSPTGQLKLAENVSPIPRDRVFFNYSLFNNVPFTPGGINVNRFSPGFEKTFLDKLVSVEFRTPFATTLDSDIFIDGSSSSNKLEFGNLFLSFKGILIGTDSWAITGGASVILPTADDVRVLQAGGNEIFRVSNDTVQVMPFLGAVATPNQNTFFQGILQIDAPVNGNSVFETLANSSVTEIGKLNNFTMLYFDFAMGHWIYRASPNSRDRILGIIPTFEAHFNRSLTQADSVTTVERYELRGPLSSFDNLNLIAGLTFQLQNRTRLAFGYAVPVGNGSDRLFDSELRATVNRFF